MNRTGKAFLIGLTTVLIVVASSIAWCQEAKPSPTPTTIEVHWCFDLLPGTDQKAFAEFVKNVIATCMKAPGLIEYRANRNVLGSPHGRATTVWQSLSDWAKFVESKEWAEIEAKARTFQTNIRVEIWGPSPLVPKPLRPGQ
jgi:hypothetical protein